MPRKFVKNMSPQKQTNTNKKHVAHAQQVKQQEKMIFYAAIAVIVLVVGIVVFGYLNKNVFQQYYTVASVNGDRITAKEFQTQAKLQRLQLINDFQRNVQFAQMFGIQDPYNDPNFGPALQRDLQALQDTNTLGQQVVDALIDDRLIRQEAAKRGITVSAADIDKEMQERYGYFANGTPVPSATPTEPVEPPLNATQLALVTLTPTASPIPSATPTIEPTVDLTATATTAPTATPTEIEIKPEGSPTPEPTATPYTLELFQKDLKTSIDELNKQVGLTETDYRRLYESIILRQKVQEAVTADLKPFEEQVWAQHILVADEATANKVLNELKNGGDWDKLAATYSIDTSNSTKGGDLGWFGRGAMVKEFEDAAFALKIGEISQPVKTQFGFHIIRVLGHEDRPLNADGFTQYKNRVFNEWLKSARAAADVYTNDAFWKEIVPTEPALPTQQQ